MIFKFEFRIKMRHRFKLIARSDTLQFVCNHDSLVPSISYVYELISPEIRVSFFKLLHHIRKLGGCFRL